MATLYEYKEDSDRGNGYYVNIWYKGPKTLQTPDITGELYDKLGYSASPNEGDQIPNRLVWGLENVGLHHYKDEDIEFNQDEIIETIEQDSVRISEGEKEKIREFIEDKEDKRLLDVAEELGIEINDAGSIQSGKGGDQDPTDMLIESGYDFPERVESAVKDWDIAGSVDDSLATIDKNKRVRESIRRMRNHPWEVCQIDASEEVVRYEIRSEEIKISSLFDANRMLRGVPGYVTVDEHVSDKSEIDYDVQRRDETWDFNSSLQIENGVILGEAMSEEDRDRKTIDGANIISTVLLSFICIEFGDGLDDYTVRGDVSVDFAQANLYKAYQELKNRDMY